MFALGVSHSLHEGAQVTRHEGAQVTRHEGAQVTASQLEASLTSLATTKLEAPYHQYPVYHV